MLPPHDNLGHDSTYCLTVTSCLSPLQDGQYDRIQSLLSDPNASLDARCPLTGDTPLIAAARNGHERVVELLIRMGADVTLQNDMEEGVFEVSSKRLKKIIMGKLLCTEEATCVCVCVCMPHDSLSVLTFRLYLSRRSSHVQCPGPPAERLAGRCCVCQETLGEHASCLKCLPLFVSVE